MATRWYSTLLMVRATAGAMQNLRYITKFGISLKIINQYEEVYILTRGALYLPCSERWYT